MSRSNDDNQPAETPDPYAFPSSVRGPNEVPRNVPPPVIKQEIAPVATAKKVRVPKPERPVKSRESRPARTGRGVRPLVVGGLVALALVAGSVPGYIVGKGSGVTQVSEATQNAALSANNLTYLPQGFTAGQILDNPSVEEVQADKSRVVTTIVDALSAEFGIEFAETEPAPPTLVQPDSLLYQVSPTGYMASGRTFTVAERERIIDIVNAAAAANGYSEFDIASLSVGMFADEQERIKTFGSADPISSDFLNVAGSSVEGGATSYVVAVVGGTESDKAGAPSPSITVSLSSYPNLREADRDAFTDRVNSEFASGNVTSR